MADTYMVNGNTSGKFFSPAATIAEASMSASADVGYMRGLSFGGLSTTYWCNGNTSGQRNFQPGLVRSDTEGNPSPPSLKLMYPGMFRFRWSLKVGSRFVSIMVKQNDLLASQRPTLVVRANSDVGVPLDLTATAAAGSNWKTIGPITFSTTAVGVVWVEAYNNLQMSNAPAYFDHIVVT